MTCRSSIYPSHLAFSCLSFQTSSRPLGLHLTLPVFVLPLPEFSDQLKITSRPSGLRFTLSLRALRNMVQGSMTYGSSFYIPAGITSKSNQSHATIAVLSLILPSGWARGPNIHDLGVLTSLFSGAALATQLASPPAASRLPVWEVQLILPCLLWSHCTQVYPWGFQLIILFVIDSIQTRQGHPLLWAGGQHRLCISHGLAVFLPSLLRGMYKTQRVPSATPQHPANGRAVNRLSFPLAAYPTRKGHAVGLWLTNNFPRQGH